MIDGRAFANSKNYLFTISEFSPLRKVKIYERIFFERANHKLQQISVLKFFGSKIPEKTCHDLDL